MSQPRTMFDKIWDAHVVAEGPGGQTLLFVDRHLLHEGAEGREREDFVLNQPPFRQAGILVTAANFGCGSSREWAVWALDAFGIRAVIGSSFGDIFHENCLKNGLLPVRLSADVVADLRGQLHASPGAAMTVDLETQTVRAPDGTAHRFEVDPFRKQALLSGQDEIALTLTHESAIAAFEGRRRAEAPGSSAEAGPCQVMHPGGTVTTAMHATPKR